MAVSRRDLHSAPTCRATQPTRIIAARAAPARRSARQRRFPRPTSSMRGAAFRISRSRTRARSRTNSAKPSATASMAATIALRCARGTSSRKPAAKSKLSARAELRAPLRWLELVAARRRRVPRAVCKIAGQAHRPRPLHPQRADRDRQRRRCLAGTRGRTIARRRKPAGARRGGLGAVAIDGARRFRCEAWRSAPGPSRPTWRSAARNGRIARRTLDFVAR